MQVCEKIDLDFSGLLSTEGRRDFLSIGGSNLGPDIGGSSRGPDIGDAAVFLVLETDGHLFSRTITMDQWSVSTNVQNADPGSMS